jgi:hypothetical protein
MVLQTYTIDVPFGYHVRTPSIYKLKTLDPEYVEMRGGQRKVNDTIVVPDKDLNSSPKEKRAYQNRVHYVRKKNGIRASDISNISNISEEERAIKEKRAEYNRIAYIRKKELIVVA